MLIRSYADICLEVVLVRSCSGNISLETLRHAEWSSGLKYGARFTQTKFALRYHLRSELA